MIPAACPRCEQPLAGLATFCHVCEEYVADMMLPEGAEARETPRETREEPRAEVDIQLGIRRALEMLGFDVYDLSQDRPTRQTPGLGDLYVIGRGRCAWVEVKRPDGRQSEVQELFEARVRANGGEYHVWRSEEEAIRWAEALKTRRAS